MKKKKFSFNVRQEARQMVQAVLKQDRPMASPLIASYVSKQIDKVLTTYC